MATYDQGDGHRRWSAEVATVTVGLDGIVTGWSEGARRLLGHRAPDVVGRAAADLLLGREVPQAAGLALTGSQEWSGTAALRHRDGHRVEVTLHAHPSLGGDGTPQAFVVAVTTPISGSRHDRTMVEWAFAQASIALSAHSTASRSWHLNAAAERGEQVFGAGGEQPGAAPADEDFLRCVRRVAEEAIPMRYERAAPEPSSAPAPARRQAWIIELWPVRDPATGEVVGVGTAAFDSSDQHSARQRLALLQEAGTSIGTTLNVTRTAKELAVLAVPRLADFASVDLLDSVLRGEEPVAGPVEANVVLRRVAHRSATRGDVVPDAAVDLGGIDDYPPFSPPARCLTGGRPVLSGADDPDFARWIAGRVSRTTAVETYGIHSVIATPLRARGITLGVAVFVRTEGSPPFEQDDLILAEELAGRAAVGVDNARRYTRERTNALTLQRSLLPRDLPKQAAVEVAYRYLPAGRGAGVGGDWFDVVPLSGTRVALVVGDVVGHGIHASATMGRLRTAVRTLADVDLPPDELLTHLDDLVIHLTSDDDTVDGRIREDSGEIGATCLYAVYDPVSRVCTVASAGHVPPAVLLPDGTVSVVRLTPGPLLGVGGLPFESTELELPEGSLLAFFTDGLIEARDRDVGLGLERLCEALAAPVPSLDVTCDTILKALLPESPADDVALLLARTRALHADQVAAWSLPSDPAIVADARAQASRQLTAWGLEDAAFVTELVVSELVTNAIRYGAVPIGLRLIRDRTLICEVSDASNTAPHLRRARTYDEGGRGLHMVAQLTQGWGTRQTPVGKTIWAEQTLPAG
ncbi:ATP-binding SpoIIE family protein phosphatase [Streptomyces guryensis]|uniref:SpoIIE family protein phosphatase n=1 Tax=Streptomyces guryensis TaxID=2886947 RepID=A0A9Q3VX81_9ACTN|nr:SpoIIE family protein phosphatase [Streptomyces guryensis]MCD9880096.1 SpoIIE family protein phosphatase [Streptomyces guryensis]